MESQDLGACLGSKPELHVATHTVDRNLRPSARRHRIAVIAGTRPEAIKLAPVAAALSRRPAFELMLLAAGQHDGEVRDVFDDWRLAYTALAPIGAAGGGWRRTCKLQTARLRGLLSAAQVDAVVVQGDTSSALAGALAAKSIGSLLAHVEAGLRSPDARDPHPEDLIRRLITRHAALHFAPTPGAGAQLINEGIPQRSVFIVGSTAVDALRRSRSIASHAAAPDLVVTLHRRENWAANLDKICAALLALANARPGLRILWPLHPNPTLADRVRRNLNGHPDFTLAAPMRHQDFLAAVKAAGRILTDSGGIQEEVPYLGAHALVARHCTERPESIVSGHVKLIAPDSPELHDALLALLESRRPEPSPFDNAAPWGDGQAGARIASLMEQCLAEYHHAPCF